MSNADRPTKAGHTQAVSGVRSGAVSQSETEGANTTQAKLNDVMIAMDVVDTLRHDRALVERELADGERRRALIKRLREIYQSQGLSVPDAILEQGVRALEDDRFTYSPPDPAAFSTRLARLYVSRMRWGRYVAGAILAIAVLFGANYVFLERPRELAAAADARAKQTLPAELTRLANAISSESRDDAAKNDAAQLAASGRNAVATGNLKAARDMRDQLSANLARLRETFQIRIVNEQGELSGLWRVPPNNPNAYNFYLVVEAIGPDGKPIPQTIRNEETGRSERVTRWAVRVDREVLARVRADKEDDGIIQSAIVGRKVRGRMQPTWSIPVRGGAITRWN